MAEHEPQNSAAAQPSSSDSAQRRTALLVVDVQPTFCEGGALPVEGGNDVAANVADLLAGEHGYDLVVTTQDWHIDPGDHFSDEPDFVDTSPPHAPSRPTSASTSSSHAEPPAGGPVPGRSCTVSSCDAQPRGGCGALSAPACVHGRGDSGSEPSRG